MTQTTGLNKPTKVREGGSPRVVTGVVSGTGTVDPPITTLIPGEWDWKTCSERVKIKKFLEEEKENELTVYEERMVNDVHES